MAAEVVCRLAHGSWSAVLLKELNVLRESGIMCDVKIILNGGIQTVAHGCVLSAASPFFKTLLTQIENPEIDMSTFPSNVILQVLNFIYTGQAHFSYSDLNIARRVTMMFNMTILDTLLQNMQQLDKAGTEKTTIIAVSDVPDGNPVAAPLSTVIDGASEQLMDGTQYKDDINNISTQLLQSAEDGGLIQHNINNIVPAMKDLGSESELKADQSRYDDESLTKYNELDTVQLQNVLNDIVDIAQLVVKENHNKNSQRIKRHPPRQRAFRVQNKAVASDGSVPDRAVQTLPDELTIDISKLSPDEKGVFALTSFPRGSTFGPYEGDIITDADAISQIQPRYCWTIYEDCKLLHWLSGEDTSKANWMRYVHATADDDANLKAFQHKGELFFEVVRRIAAREELLVSNTYIGYRGNLYTNSTKAEEKNTEGIENNGPAVDDTNVVMHSAEVEQKDAVKNEDDTVPAAGTDDGTAGGEDEEETDFPCEDCDVIFLVKDMYYKHMHKVHGKPLPLHIYLGNSETCEAKTSGKPETTAKGSLDDRVSTNHQPTSAEDVVSKAGNELIDNTFSEALSDYNNSGTIKDGDVLHVRRSHRNRRLSTRLENFYVPAASVSVSVTSVKMSDSSVDIFAGESSTRGQVMVTADAEGSNLAYKCDVCQKAFKLEMSLKRHLRLHLPDIQDNIKCEQCGKVFTHMGNLKIHMRIHTGERPFKCEICGRGFSQNGNRELHMSRHRNENTHICDICGKSCNDSSYLKKHMRIQHSGTNTIQCPKCSKKLYDTASLRRHMVTHTDKKLYKCSTCGKGFNQYANLRSHKRVHSAEKPFKCQECGLCYRTEHELSLHGMSHKGGAKQYKCKVCLKTFPYVTSFKKHLRSGCKAQLLSADAQQSEESGASYKCRICDSVFSKAEDGETHIISHFYECSICRKVFSDETLLSSHQIKHGDYKPFCCNHCGKCYHDRYSLKTHLRVHSAKLHQCPVCQKSWPTASILRNHMLVHTGEKPHACTVCNMHFRMKHQLKRHMLIHDVQNGLVRIPEKPRPICPTCGKSFHDKQGLKKHEFLHTGLKPFKCKFCNKAFATRGTMKAHFEGHLGEKRFKCTLCDKSYRANKDCQRHMATHLPEHQKAHQCAFCEKSFPYKKSLRLHMRCHDVQNL